MNYKKLLKYYNVRKFKDVKKLLNKNDIFVQDIVSVYMILYVKNGKYNRFADVYDECHGTIYEKETNRVIVESSSPPPYIPYTHNNSVNTIGIIIFIFCVFIIFILYKYT